MWFGYWTRERPVWGRLMEFWKENTAQHWGEHMFNDAVLQTLRVVNSGMLPAFQ